ARKSASLSALQPRVPRWVSEMKIVRWRRTRPKASDEAGRDFSSSFEAGPGRVLNGYADTTDSPMRLSAGDMRDLRDRCVAVWLRLYVFVRERIKIGPNTCPAPVLAGLE